MIIVRFHRVEKSTFKCLMLCYICYDKVLQGIYFFSEFDGNNLARSWTLVCRVAELGVETF
jgi:hypothetical protein